MVKILKPGLVKGAWSEEEDEALKDFVTQFGASCWAEAVNYIHGRSSKQCRERWNNILNPNVKKGQWTADEDNLIFKMYGELGTQWTRMVEFLPGRTKNSIKNRFYSSLRKYVKHNDAVVKAETP